MFTYSQASKNKDIKALTALKQSSNEVIADVSAYSASILENKNSDSKLYEEMAIIEEAYLAIKSGDMKNAKIKLERIGEDSALSMLASLLKHSIIKAK